MPKINCYFCKTNNGIERDYQFFCIKCMGNHISHVITSCNFTRSEFNYIHIYIDKLGIYTKNDISTKFKYSTPYYHIRLSILNNSTQILSDSISSDKSSSNLISELDGFPINPQNVEAKLQTILVFS